MVEFGWQYGIVQNTLLKELSIPYAILLDDGKNHLDEHTVPEVLGTTIRKDTYLSKYIPELNRGVFPKEENESVSLEFNYLDRDYQAEIQCVSVEGFSETEQPSGDTGGKGIFYCDTSSGCDRAEPVYPGE